MPTARDILANKSHPARLISILDSASVLEACRRMNEHHVGALVVGDARDQLAGLFSERDVLTRVVAPEREPARTIVRDVMTTAVIVASPDTRLHELRAIMRDKRVRHIPIMDEGHCLGLISIGDVNAAESEDMALTIRYLEQYISPA